MVKSKETNVLPRPMPPTPEEILADVMRASEDDPVFSLSPEGLQGNGVDLEDSEPDEKMDVSGETMKVEEQYVKVCDLLDMISSLRSGKDRLDNLCQQLLNSKEDVSAVVLQLKTRLEKHKIMSNRSGDS